jgi:hypothetical protein
MKKAFIMAIVVTLALSLPAFAADNTQLQQASGPSFEEMKAGVLKHIGEHIAGMEQERACVQAAKSNEDLKTCRDKFGPPKPPGGPGGEGRPGGQGGPGGQAAPQGR